MPAPKLKSKFAPGSAPDIIVNNSGNGVSEGMKGPKPGINPYKGWSGGKSPKEDPDPKTMPK